MLFAIHLLCGLESLLADFDHDGHVGLSEIQQIKDNLHQFFDIDESGSIDTKEIKTVHLTLVWLVPAQLPPSKRLIG